MLTEFYKLNMIAVYYRESPYKSAVTGRRQDCDNITSNHRNFSLLTTRSHWELGSQYLYKRQLYRSLADWKWKGIQASYLPYILVCLKFAGWQCCVNILHMEHNFIQVCFQLATVHCSQAIHIPTIQRYAATVAWHKADGFSDINTTHRALRTWWIEAKWLMWQQRWWKSDRGCVMGTDQLLSLHCSSSVWLKVHS